MLTVYKKRTIPKDAEVIEFNDVYFNKYTAGRLDERAKDIIKEIDHSNWIGGYSITSRFDGTILNIDKLSTGCKTVLNVLYNPDKIFDIRECGDNALDVLYALNDGKIYCDYPLISFDMDKVTVREKNEDRIIVSYDELKEWWTNEN